MKRSLLLLMLGFIITSCGTSRHLVSENVRLTFLDDHIIPKDLEIGGTKVGGISGIEYHNDTYYLVSDHPGNPRFYISEIKIDQQKIDTVSISEVITLDQSAPFLKGKTLDLESIRYDAEKDEFVITSEGSIQNNKEPSIFRVTPEGKFISNFSLPEYFMPSEVQQPRNNGVFEGLTKSTEGNGYWTGMELPLVKDGSKPKLFPTKSPVRITHFDENGDPDKQFVLHLEGITKIPWLYFAVNGLTELLEYAPGRFLVLERAFSAGHGSNGNTIRIFDVDAREATNTLEANNLRKTDYTPAKKTLVYDFKNIRKDLKEKIIDNIEGMTFGPDLSNGNKTLLLASDNNFNSLGKQISQIILMEITINN